MEGAVSVTPSTGVELRRRREEQGVTGPQLARAMRVNLYHLYRVENGRRPLKPEFAARAMDALREIHARRGRKLGEGANSS